MVETLDDVIAKHIIVRDPDGFFYKLRVPPTIKTKEQAFEWTKIPGLPNYLEAIELQTIIRFPKN